METTTLFGAIYRGHIGIMEKKMETTIMGYICRGLGFRWIPDPVIVTIRDNRDYARALLFCYYTTITWGGSS